MITIFRPPQETLLQKATRYVSENPATVAKYAGIGLAGAIAYPVLIGAAGWAPYIGAGYIAYKKFRAAQTTITLAQRLKNNIQRLWA